MPEPSLNWPLPDHRDIEEQLIEAYSTGRGYHDLRHLTEVLSRLDELGEGRNVELVLAAWFHDAVYEPGSDHDPKPDRPAGDNEERSAQLAETLLEGTDVDVVEVARLVRLTKAHDPRPGDRNGEALCDADLAILAASPERYEEYAAGVRREYAAYSDAEFRSGRLAVLQDLASRQALFRTAYAREHWEPQARHNLAAEISKLRIHGG